MQPIDEQYARSFVQAIKSALSRTGVDYDTIIDNHGQVQACVRRDAGYSFTLKEHVRGLVLAQLQTLRTWDPAVDNLRKVNTVFFDYEPDRLLATDLIELTQKLEKAGYSGGSLKKIGRASCRERV